MKITAIDLHCLNSICDDYENLPLIINEVKQAIRRDITDKAIESSLFKLVQCGFVAVYDFDSGKSSFRPSSIDPIHWPSKWFLITPLGREALEKNWDDS